MNIRPIENFSKVIVPPADKSIMQRAVILGFLSGEITINNPSFCADAISAIECISKLGANCFMQGASLVIKSGNIPQKNCLLDAGNSATALRLLLGVAAGKGIQATLSGDKSLKSRNLKDTLLALNALGANFESKNYHAPVKNLPAQLKGAKVFIKNPSAQVKSAALISALFADGESIICEKTPTRDHTERMLLAMGANLQTVKECPKSDLDSENKSSEYKNIIKISPSKLKGIKVTVCGDISSAAYMIAMGALRGGVTIKNCGLNPSRMGMIILLKNAGLDITVQTLGESNQEPYGNIIVKSSSFRGFDINASFLPTLIDEVPILAVMACFASSDSCFSGLSTLKNKETDRLNAIYNSLKDYGADITIKNDSLYIRAGITPKKIVVDSTDHRMVMAMSVAAAVGVGGNIITSKAVNVSYPNFFEDLTF